MPDIGQVLREMQERVNRALDDGRADILDLRRQGKQALADLAAVTSTVAGLVTQASQLRARLTNDEAAFTALANRVAAAEAELVKLDPTYTPPTS